VRSNARLSRKRSVQLLYICTGTVQMSDTRTIEENDIEGEDDG
jgi:hypothetical protein